MRINAISMTMETRVNYGDYQGAMANLRAEAELGDETPEEGFKQLRATLQQQLVYCIKSGSPTAVRSLMKGEKAEDESEEDGKKTRKRRTKAEIEAAKKAEKTAKKPKDDLDDDNGLDDDLDSLDGPEESDDGNDLEDDEGLGEEEIDRPKVMAKLRELKAEKGAAAMQQVIKKTGAASFKEVANEDLERLYKLAIKKLNE